MLETQKQMSRRMKKRRTRTRKKTNQTQIRLHANKNKKATKQTNDRQGRGLRAAEATTKQCMRNQGRSYWLRPRLEHNYFVRNRHRHRQRNIDEHHDAAGQDTEMRKRTMRRRTGCAGYGVCVEVSSHRGCVPWAQHPEWIE